MAKGVTINVVTLKGQDCNMDYLSSLALMTGGAVQIVDPNSFESTFKNGIEQKFIAR